MIEFRHQSIPNGRVEDLKASEPRRSSIARCDARDAALAFAFTGAFAWATVEAFNRDHDELGVALGLVTLAFYAGNIFSAVNVAHKFNDREERRLKERIAPYERVGSIGQRPASLSLALKFFF